METNMVLFTNTSHAHVTSIYLSSTQSKCKRASLQGNAQKHACKESTPHHMRCASSKVADIGLLDVAAGCRSSVTQSCTASVLCRQALHTQGGTSFSQCNAPNTSLSPIHLISHSPPLPRNCRRPAAARAAVCARADSLFRAPAAPMPRPIALARPAASAQRAVSPRVACVAQAAAVPSSWPQQRGS